MHGNWTTRYYDTGFTDKHWVVLGLAGQNPYDVADLCIATDDGIKLTCAGTRSKVVTELLKRVLRILFDWIDLFIHDIFLL